MYQQLCGYKVEEKLYLGVREQKRLNTTDLDDICGPANCVHRMGVAQSIGSNRAGALPLYPETKEEPSSRMLSF
jgi:hypothetical protein